MNLNRESPIPLYFQIEEILSRNIEDGQIPPGAALPTEEQLEKEYGVSRITVRQAIARLVLAGKVKRIPGKGTFVTEQGRIGKPGLRSVIEDLAAQNVRFENKIITAQIERPPRRVADLLRIATTEEVVHLERIRFANGEPIFLYDSFLPHRLVPNLHQTSLIESSLYKTLEKLYSLIPKDGEEEMEATLATAHQAQLLQISPGAPVLVTWRVTYLADRVPMEYTRSVFASGRYRYFIRLAGASIRPGTL